MSDERSAQRARRSSSIYLGGGLIVVVALVLLSILLLKQRAYVSGEIQSRTAAVEAGPRVQVVSATQAPGTRSVPLVGEARSYFTATLYAKVSGYLSVINVDKGDKVVADQLLAVIQSPELDRQYDAAVADAISKRLIAQRNNELLKTGAVSPQTAEQTEATAKTAEDTAASLREQKDYELIKAPFAGTITARYADPGALIQAATTGSGTALPVVTVSQTDRLRVYVYPDQKTASLVRVGDPAEIADAARPDVKVSGEVGRTSSELDTKTRTLLVEIDVDNREGRILPGSFVQVVLSVQTPPYPEIPANALVMRGDKPFVATLTPENTVAFQPVAIFHSNGTNVRLASGLKAGDRVIVNLGQAVVEGQKVQPVEKAAR